MGQPIHDATVGVEQVPQPLNPSLVLIWQAVVAPESPTNEIGSLNQPTHVRVCEDRHIRKMVERPKPPRHMPPIRHGTLHLQLKGVPIVYDETGLGLAELISESAQHGIEICEHALVCRTRVVRPPPVYDDTKQGERVRVVEGSERLERIVGAVHQAEPIVRPYASPWARRSAPPRTHDLSCVEFEFVRICPCW